MRQRNDDGILCVYCSNCGSEIEQDDDLFILRRRNGGKRDLCLYCFVSLAVDKLDAMKTTPYDEDCESCEDGYEMMADARAARM